MESESKQLLVIDRGTRTLAMARGVVRQVVQVLTPDCVSLCLTDGYRDYMMAFLSHFGSWLQPSRQRAYSSAPQPRWMLLPQRLYAQVVTSYLRRRRVSPRCPLSKLPSSSRMPINYGPTCARWYQRSGLTSSPA